MFSLTVFMPIWESAIQMAQLIHDISQKLQFTLNLQRLSKWSLSLSHCTNDIRESHNTYPYQVPVLAQINNIITSSCICYFGLPYSLLLAVIIHPSLPYLRECSLLSYKKCLSNSTCLLTYRYFVTEKNWEKTKENAEPKWQQFSVLKSF